MRLLGTLLFCFTFTSVLCQRREIRLSLGQEVDIENPGAPDHSPAHLNLQWILTSPPDTQIELHCYQFSLYMFDDVCNDYAFHIEGTSEGRRVVCGSPRPFTETSTQNKMTLRLVIGEMPRGRVQCKAKAVQAAVKATTQPPLAPQEQTSKNENHRIHLRIDDTAFLAEKSGSPPGMKTLWTFTTDPHLRIGVTCDDVRFSGGKDCYKWDYGIKLSDGTTEKTLCSEDTLVGQRGTPVTITYDSARGGGAFRCRVVAVKTGTHPDYFKELVTMEEDSSEFGVVAGRKRTTCECGWSNKEGARIHGGTITKMNEYSFMVGFIHESRHICGGSILDEYHVLTAAHCTRKKKAEEIQILVGAQHLYTDDEPYRQWHNVSEIIDHEKYDHDNSNFNDVSILRLKTPIKFNEMIGPVCLPTASLPNLNNKNVRVIGWGLTESGFTKELRKAVLRIVDPATCLVTNGRNLDPRDPNKMCFYSNNRDACNGDSGGPFVWLDPDTNRFTQVALVSYGRACNDTVPSVGAAVPHFMPWIQKVIGGRGCVKID